MQPDLPARSASSVSADQRSSERPARALRLLATALHADLAALYLREPAAPSLTLAATHGGAQLVLPPLLPLSAAYAAPPQLPNALVASVEADGELLGALLVARTVSAEPFDAAARAALALAAEGEAAALVAARLVAADRARERIVGQIIEQIPSSLVVFDRTLRVSLANRNFLLKARRDGRTTIGRSVAEIFPAALVRQARLDQRLREVLRSGQPFEGDRISYSAPGLPARTFFYQLVPLGGPPAEQVLLLMEDITERHRLELQVLHSAKSASLGVMAAGIAHEIRNPLSIVAAAAQVMLEHACAEPIHAEAARRIANAAQRAATIIEDLLKFARPDQAPPRPVELNALVEATLALLAQQLVFARVTLHSELAPALPTLLGSPGLLQQVLTNLILNACQAMPEGGVLTIATAQAGPELALTLTDTGHGIPPELLLQIFDPFFTTREVGAGTGLGLAISDSILRQHGGRIEVRSQPGVGSSFVIYLPLSAHVSAAPVALR